MFSVLFASSQLSSAWQVIGDQYHVVAVAARCLLLVFICRQPRPSLAEEKSQRTSTVAEAFAMGADWHSPFCRKKGLLIMNFNRGFHYKPSILSSPIFGNTLIVVYYTLPPITMEVENGCLEDDWLVSFWGPFSTSLIMGGRVSMF